MPLNISRNDIFKVKAEAIVNPTDIFMSGSGSTDRKIHKLAGRKLDEECQRIGTLPPGQAVITGAYELKDFRYIIHTCGPVYTDGQHDEEKILASCYENCLALAKEKEVSSIVFPLIAAGSFSFPQGRALRIASDVITGFLLENEMDVFLLVYDKQAFATAERLYSDIHDYLSEQLEADDGLSIMSAPVMMEACYEKEALPVFEPDESFSQCLIRMINESGFSDPQVYKKANIDRKHFNHIINNKDYRPKKETAVALAIGLQLNMDDTAALLERAGFVLSRSSKFDLIIRYCIENGIYDIYRINEILFSEDQKTLGC